MGDSCSFIKQYNSWECELIVHSSKLYIWQWFEYSFLTLELKYSFWKWYLIWMRRLGHFSWGQSNQCLELEEISDGYGHLSVKYTDNERTKLFLNSIVDTKIKTHLCLSWVTIHFSWFILRICMGHANCWMSWWSIESVQ